VLGSIDRQLYRFTDRRPPRRQRDLVLWQSGNRNPIGFNGEHGVRRWHVGKRNIHHL